MRALSTGDLAPELELASVRGGSVRLSDLRGKKVLVAFLRNAQCAVCNLWVAARSKRAPGWEESGLVVLAVFESTVAKLRAQLGERTVPFEVLADPDGAAHDAFGSRVDPEVVRAIVASGAGEEALARAEAVGFPRIIEEGANFFRLPAEILVRSDGTIERVHVAEEVTNHLDPAIVDRFARTGRS